MQPPVSSSAELVLQASARLQLPLRRLQPSPQRHQLRIGRRLAKRPRDAEGCRGMPRGRGGWENEHVRKPRTKTLPVCEVEDEMISLTQSHIHMYIYIYIHVHMCFDCFPEKELGETPSFFRMPQLVRSEKLVSQPLVLMRKSRKTTSD